MEAGSCLRSPEGMFGLPFLVFSLRRTGGGVWVRDPFSEIALVSEPWCMYVLAR